MAYKKVLEYILQYNKKPVVWVEVQGEENVLLPIYPAPGDAVFVADMLRNEKPVYYDGEKNVLSTSSEVVGEEET